MPAELLADLTSVFHKSAKQKAAVGRRVLKWLDAGGDVNCVFELSARWFYDDGKADDNSNLLMIASDLGCYSLMAALVARGVDVNFQNRRGHTALARSIMLGRRNHAMFFLFYGADCLLRDRADSTALHVAATLTDDYILIGMLHKLHCDGIPTSDLLNLLLDVKPAVASVETLMLLGAFQVVELIGQEVADFLSKYDRSGWEANAFDPKQNGTEFLRTIMERVKPFAAFGPAEARRGIASVVRGTDSSLPAFMKSLPRGKATKVMVSPRTDSLYAEVRIDRVDAEWFRDWCGAGKEDALVEMRAKHDAREMAEAAAARRADEERRRQVREGRDGHRAPCAPLAIPKPKKGSKATVSRRRTARDAAKQEADKEAHKVRLKEQRDRRTAREKELEAEAAERARLCEVARAIQHGE